ncbi:MAG TPA: hypothetical protein VFV17_06295 [Usitatibacteraceae bacterium]|nr:hypothetical protein [Usitatibacteraceae bacterium]
MNPPTAEPAASIARFGFRKWYERQLIDSHLALISCILTMVLAAASLEAFTFPAPVTTLVTFLMVFCGACYFAWLSWRRYRRVMLMAWRYGEAAVCKNCQTYGRLEVLSSGEREPLDEDGGGGAWMQVACRRCRTQWRMPE